MQGRTTKAVLARRLRPVLVTAAVALVAAASAAATTSTGSSTARAADTKAWCAAVIRVNTKYGAMKNKRFLLPGQVPLSAWKKVVDAAVAGRAQFLAMAPSPIKTAVKHQLEWFARVKANHYALTTPLGSFTLAEVKQITDFERTKCGISFG